nr:immunoglobulin heavy chain junction region [Mus musculus]
CARGDTVVRMDYW